MPIEHDAQTVGNLLRDAGRQKIVLPNFQREYVWSLEAQRKLTASLMADVPIGALLLLKGEPNDYAARRVALMVDAQPLAECVYLLDGQQRISTLASVVSSPFLDARDWRTTFGELPARLRYMWCLRVKPVDGDADLFGYSTLSFPDRIEAEPDELVNFLVPNRVLIKDADSAEAWFHPNWGSALSPDERRLGVARRASETGLVPLWALANEDVSRLIDTTLQIIAGHRRVDLSAGRDFTSSPALYESLRRADPLLPADSRNATEENAIDQAFSSLAERWRTAMSGFINAMLERQASTITLEREDIGRAVAIFEVINQGGTPLTPFDLIVAKNARDPNAANLSQQMIGHLQTHEVQVGQAAWFEPGSSPALDLWTTEGRDIGVSGGSLTTQFKNSFLNLLSLRYHSAGGTQPWQLEVRHIKRQAILAVPPVEISDGWEEVSNALLKAWAFLQIRCGVESEASLRYKLMILPIAFSYLAAPDEWESQSFNDRMEAWYWSALFGGVFRERQNERAIRELKLLQDALSGDNESVTKLKARSSLVLGVPGYSDRDTLLLVDQDTTVSSDVSSSILQYVLSRGPRDFQADEPARLYAWQDVELEDHHILPLGSAATLRDSASQLRARGDFILNSPLNRTLISKHANRSIGSKTPAGYLAELAANQPTSHELPTIETLYSIPSGDQWEQKVREFLKDRFERIRQALTSELATLWS